jgi:hypothetical protein
MYSQKQISLFIRLNIFWICSEKVMSRDKDLSGTTHNHEMVRGERFSSRNAIFPG